MADAADSFDILIAGGGMVGASLALALAPQGWRIGIVEAVPPKADSQPSYDDRATALAWSSRRILEALGVWETLAADATAITEVHTSQRGRLGIARLRAQEFDQAALGYVVPNRVLGRELVAALAAHDNVRWFCPARVVELQQDDQAACVTLETGDARTVLRARLVVAADGARSSLREQLGVAVRQHDYAERAVIVNVTPEIPHAGRAFERFTDAGPIALLPLGERCDVVCTVAEAETEAVLALNDADFQVYLENRFGARLGRLTRPGKRLSYPLRQVQAERQQVGRVLIAGNAAHSLHPVAGQGFNLSLRDVAVLAEVLACGDDPGSEALLQRYLEVRRSDQRAIGRFTDTLLGVFALPGSFPAHLRGLGLLALDLLPGLRQVFGRFTMGLSGRVPRLARGARVERS